MKKYENITLVVLAYVIGFNTAFIAFGIEMDLYSGEESPTNYNSQQAALANVISTRVEEREDGLYVVTDEGERILSAEVDDGEINSQEGFHNAIVTAQVSPKGELIHYCAQAKAEDNFCFNYIYELKTDSVYRVQTSTGEHVASLISASGDSWSGSRGLMIEGMVSVNDDTPWKLR